LRLRDAGDLPGIPHPPDSLDISPCDWKLFGILKESRRIGRDETEVAVQIYEMLAIERALTCDM
jgi:hypothetical protein